MRRVVVAAALTCSAGVVVVAPAAPGWADDGGTQPNVTSFGFSVSPRTVAPGGTVTLSSNGCQTPTVKADAPVFDTTELNEGHSATARVYDDAKPGAQYQVQFTCGNETGTTTLTIATGSINHGVNAGTGGSVGGFDATQMAIGGALVAGVLAAGLYLVRRQQHNGT